MKKLRKHSVNTSMKLSELKKAEPATTKSSGTDDPSKYVGGWEAYDKPQGINDRQDRKVLAKEDVQDWNGKSVVWSGEGYHVAVDDPQDAGYITAWTDDNERIGSLSASRSRNKKGWVEVGSVDVDPNYRRNRIALRMYQALSQYMGQQYQGILGYRPDIADPSKIEPIYQRLGGMVDPENEDILLAPRKTFFESNSYGPAGGTRFAPDPDELEFSVSDEDAKEIKASAKPPKGQVRMNVKALSARGKPAKLNPYRLDETIRSIINGTLNAEYEIVNEDESAIGYAAVRDGVIENLDYDTDAKQDYRGHILSALLSQIVTEADLNRANLAIKVNEMNGEIKNLLERFGFRRSGGTVMKRTYGAIRPTSVSPPQGMVNRPD